MNCLQNHLSDSDICKILSMASGQNQKILNFLILRLKNKEDLLDFCDSLEKIDGASPSLKIIAEQLRKGTSITATYVFIVISYLIIMHIYAYTSCI